MKSKKLVALLTAVSLSAAAFAVAPAMDAQAKNEWYDGDTPKELDNSVKASNGMKYHSNVKTNFHFSSMPSVIASSPKAYIDNLTAVDVSYYDDAQSVFFIDDNTEYGDAAKAVITHAVDIIHGTMYPAFTMNLFKYEGQAYKPIEYTTQDIQFMMGISDKIYESGREYMVLRLNEDATVSYLRDQDLDPYTVTFDTNYFKADCLYCMMSAPAGMLDEYEGALALLAQ